MQEELVIQTHNLKKTMKTIEHLAGAQKNHAEQKVVFNTNKDRQ